MATGYSFSSGLHGDGVRRALFGADAAAFAVLEVDADGLAVLDQYRGVGAVEVDSMQPSHFSPSMTGTSERQPPVSL